MNDNIDDNKIKGIRNSRYTRSLKTSQKRDSSRERERIRRKNQAECIRKAGGFEKLADSEGKKPIKLFWDGFQWVAKTSANAALLADPILVNSTRKLRRLYFGNLPLHLGLTKSDFQDLVWNEMKKRNLCNDPNESPIICVWFAKDKGNYGFVEFSSIEETAKALKLDGIDCMGNQIKVSRPNDYCSATKMIGNTTTQSKSSTGRLVANPNLAAQTGEALAAQLLSQGVRNLDNTRLIVLKHMILQSEVDSIEEYTEILEDVLEGVQQFGTVIGAAIITPDIPKVDSSYDSGDVYILFATPEEAKNCIYQLKKWKYYDRVIITQNVATEVWNHRISKLPKKLLKIIS